MPTYRDIDDYAREHFGVRLKSCWIAHVKADYGLTRGPSWRRIDPNWRAVPCPPSMRPIIEAILRVFGLI